MSFFSIILEDLKEPKRQDPAFRGVFELFFNYPGVWAIVHYRFANLLWRHGWKRLARAVAGVSNFLTRVDLHPGATIGRRVFLDHATGVVIGETACIGDECLIYQGVTLGGVSLSRGKRHPTLKNGVVVGAGAKVLGNITIGENSKIGANSVVIRDVGDNCTAVGIPARVVGEREKEPLEHGKLPDVNGELFVYILDRLANLETALHASCQKLDVSSDEPAETLQKVLKSLKEKDV